ncbi:pyridoxamine 5'-phosphate oxidase [Moraxella nasibovis]|uniref:pyridoxamine 5'-phosphate oxidase n=1 Tax=Moraxella nasibovis TaxID=2904120 RepID=UPI002410A7B2|nr:pyridoxamine 5'-phosphate oxidase [Moraxella nasibovis]WFF38774.1 pyridoxamine 5'-phosphate oxidase [Moraxella nasibovis]
MNLHDIREDYSKQELDSLHCHDNPLEQFKIWLNDAMTAKVNEPTAMNIATVDANGRPSSRMVLLKEVNDDGFVFFSNYDSRKGQALAVNPYISITFFWAELERQVRIEGVVEKLDERSSDEYFDSRPYTSRIGAWASEQSQVIADKSVIVKRAAMFGIKHPLHVPRPPHWGGYLVRADKVEFWQGRPSRLHDRIRYRLDGDEWVVERLAP